MGGSEGGAEAFFALGVDAWIHCFQVFDCFDEDEALRDGEDAIPFCILLVSRLVTLECLLSNGTVREMGMGVAYD